MTHVSVRTAVHDRLILLDPDRHRKKPTQHGYGPLPKRDAPDHEDDPRVKRPGRQHGDAGGSEGKSNGKGHDNADEYQQK
jgi:hypothetical protein